MCWGLQGLGRGSHKGVGDDAVVSRVGVGFISRARRRRENADERPCVCVRPHLFGDGVQGRRRLVVQEDGRILQHGAGDGDALLLPA